MLAAALACGACLLAYRHGQLSASRASECSCGRVSPDMLHREDEQLSSIPSTERTMVSCMLQTPELRGVLRTRLHTCLHERGALDPSSAAAALVEPQLPSPSATASSSLIQPPPPPPASAAAARAVQERPPPPPPLLSSATPHDPLLAQLEVSRANEAELPSAPVFESAPDAADGEWVAAAAAAAVSARLLTIGCVANGRLLSVDPPTDWMQCSGDASTDTSSGAASAAGLRAALFAQEAQPSSAIAFRHVATGRYLQVTHTHPLTQPSPLKPDPSPEPALTYRRARAPPLTSRAAAPLRSCRRVRTTHGWSVRTPPPWYVHNARAAALPPGRPLRLEPPPCRPAVR